MKNHPLKDLEKPLRTVTFDVSIDNIRTFNPRWKSILESRIVVAPEIDLLEYKAMTDDINTYMKVEIVFEGKSIEFMLDLRSYYIVGYVVDNGVLLFTNPEENDLLRYRKPIATVPDTIYDEFSFSLYFDMAFTDFKKPTHDIKQNFFSRCVKAFEFFAFFVSESARLEPCRIAMLSLLINTFYCERQGLLRPTGFPTSFYREGGYEPGKINRTNMLSVMNNWDKIAKFAGITNSIVKISDIQSYFIKHLSDWDRNEKQLLAIGIQLPPFGPPPPPDPPAPPPDPPAPPPDPPAPPPDPPAPQG